MGREARCRVHFQGKTVEAKVLLETKEIVVRGDLKLRVPLDEARGVTAEGGTLKLSFGQGGIAIDLGDDAARWAKRILAPPSRLDKLGVKSGHTVVLVDGSDAGFARELAERTGAPALTKPKAGADLIFFEARTRKALDGMAKLKAFLRDDGALWVLRPKQSADCRHPDISEKDVMAAGKAAGLTDVKVVAFSDALTAEKFVIPVAQRKGRA